MKRTMSTTFELDCLPDLMEFDCNFKHYNATSVYFENTGITVEQVESDDGTFIYTLSLKSALGNNEVIRITKNNFYNLISGYMPVTKEVYEIYNGDELKFKIETYSNKITLQVFTSVEIPEVFNKRIIEELSNVR